MTHKGKRKYCCRTCHSEKWVPYEGQEPPDRIQTGCENCGYIQSFGKVPWGM